MVFVFDLFKVELLAVLQITSTFLLVYLVFIGFIQKKSILKGLFLIFILLMVILYSFLSLYHIKTTIDEYNDCKAYYVYYPEPFDKYNFTFLEKCNYSNQTIQSFREIGYNIKYPQQTTSVDTVYDWEEAFKQVIQDELD